MSQRRAAAHIVMGFVLAYLVVAASNAPALAGRGPPPILTPLKTIALGVGGLFPSVAFDGRRAVVSLGAELLLVDVEMGTVATALPAQAGHAAPAERQPYWHVLFAAGGKELWLLNASRRGAGSRSTWSPAVRT